ncbi:conjugal transfer protein TraC [Candidatus Peregrinibacteria bacterium]|nr:MAG: conjugal transfer protein TraC [Candidatus Peregrinibacteria bacterium]
MTDITNTSTAKKISLFNRIAAIFQKKKTSPFKDVKKTSQEVRPEKNKEVVLETAHISAKDSKKDKLEEIKKLKEAEKRYHEGMVALKDLIAPDSMQVSPTYIETGGTFSRTFFVYSYPRFIESNWLFSIINLDVSFDISLFVYPSTSEDIMKLLRKKVAQMRSTIRMYEEKGKVRDPGIDIALQDAEELRVQLQKGEEKFFHLGAYLTLHAKDKDQLDKLSTEIESILGGQMILTKRANLQMEQGFISSLPLGLDNLQVVRNMNTSPLSAMFPFSSSNLTSDRGILYGLNRHNDSLIIFDRFSLENANSVVFAKSGAGKSYAVKLEMLRLMMMGVDVLVIDPEKEYKDLCDTVGGTYINISLNSQECLNPFDLPTGLKDEVTHPGDLLRSAIIHIHGLLHLMLGEVTPEESAILDKALLDCYELKDITFLTENPGDKEVPTMENLYDVLSSMEGASSLAIRLQKYTSGTFAGIFNKPTNVNLTSGMIVFNVRDLEEELRPIATYIVLNFIWNQVRSSLKKRVLVVDEAWSLMQHEYSAKFLYGLVKRARKYWLGITTITQDVDDFIHSAYGKPIITNSSLQLLLKQSPLAVESLASVFNLTDGEKYMLLNSEIGQGLFFAGNNHVACQIIASYSEDKVITTSPEEVLRKQELNKKIDENI